MKGYETRRSPPSSTSRSMRRISSRSHRPITWSRDDWSIPTQEGRCHAAAHPLVLWDPRRWRAHSWSNHRQCLVGGHDRSGAPGSGCPNDDRIIGTHLILIGPGCHNPAGHRSPTSDGSVSRSGVVRRGSSASTSGCRCVERSGSNDGARHGPAGHDTANDTDDVIAW